MADVQYWDDTLTGEVQGIRQLIQSAEGLYDRDKASALDQAEKKLRAAQGTEKSYKMETRLVFNPGQRRMYENKVSQLSEELASCVNDLRALKGEMHRGELFVGARGASLLGNDRDGMTGEEAGDIMLGEMNDIQDKTKSSLQNTKNMVAASKEVGEVTRVELLRQREVIRTIDEEAICSEENLNRSDKLIKTFRKRMATDRFIQCLACINIVLFVGVVVYSLLKRGSGTEGGNDRAPASSVGGRATGGGRLLHSLPPLGSNW